MPREFEQIRCQRCRAVNPVGEELCDKCGTRLMLVVEPTAQRYEPGGGAGTEREALLLERLTLLETHLTRFADKLQHALDLMLKQAQHAYDNQLLLQTLAALLDELGVIEHEELKRRFRELSDAEAFEQKARELRRELREVMVAAYRGDEKAAFSEVVEQGLARLSAGDAVEGLRALEAAAASSPENSPLHVFLGEHFFRAGKFALAAGYLARARESGDRRPRTTLLLGISLVDEGERDGDGRDFIRESVAQGDDSFAAHYALGRLAALAGGWGKAAGHFKSALAARPCPEAHYLCALASHLAARHRVALRHAQKAVELDPNYGEVFYLLCLIHRSLGDPAAERVAYAQAKFIHRAAVAAKQLPPGRPPKPSMVGLLHGLLGAAQHGGRQRLTAGDQRLARLMREDALAFSPAAAR